MNDSWGKPFFQPPDLRAKSGIERGSFVDSAPDCVGEFLDVWVLGILSFTDLLPLVRLLRAASSRLGHSDGQGI